MMKLTVTSDLDRVIDTRRDPVTHLKVESAQRIQRTEGTRSAAEQLVANGVALRVAIRVLATSNVRTRPAC